MSRVQVPAHNKEGIRQGESGPPFATSTNRMDNQQVTNTIALPGTPNWLLTWLSCTGVGACGNPTVCEQRGLRIWCGCGNNCYYCLNASYTKIHYIGHLVFLLPSGCFPQHAGLFSFGTDLASKYDRINRWTGPYKPSRTYEYALGSLCSLHWTRCSCLSSKREVRASMPAFLGNAVPGRAIES